MPNAYESAQQRRAAWDEIDARNRGELTRHIEELARIKVGRGVNSRHVHTVELPDLKLTGPAGAFMLLKKILQSIGKRRRADAELFARPGGSIRIEWRTYWAEIGAIRVERIN